MSDDSVPFNPMSSDASNIGGDGVVEGLDDQVIEDVAEGEEPSSEEPQEEVPEAAAEAPVPAQEEPPISKEADRLAKSFEKISRRDLEQRKKEKELKAYEEAVKRAQHLESLAKSDQIQLLRELGVSVDTVLKAHLNGGAPDPVEKVTALEAKVAELESYIKQTREGFDARDAGNKWENDFVPLYQSSDYDIIRDDIDNADDVVRKRTLDHYNKTGELLHPKTVLDTMKKEAQNRLNKLSKYISAGSSGNVPTNPAPSTPVAPIKTGPKTLTPKTAAVIRHTRVLDDEEEMAMISAKYTRADR